MKSFSVTELVFCYQWYASITSSLQHQLLSETIGMAGLS